MAFVYQCDTLACDVYNNVRVTTPPSSVTSVLDYNILESDILQGETTILKNVSSNPF